MCKQPISADLKVLKADIEKWRSAKRWRGEKMPKELWERAVQLRAQYSEHALRDYLGLDRKNLKRRTQERLGAGGVLQRQAKSQELQFVEVNKGLQQETFPKTIIEIRRPDGASMRIEQPTPLCFGALLQSFFEGI